MRRFQKNLLGLTALGLAATAGAQSVTPVAPVDGNDELVGPNTILTVDLGTLDAGEPVTLNLTIFTVADDDTVTDLFTLAVPAAATDGDGNGTFGDAATTDGGGDAAGVGIDVSGVTGFGSAIQSAADAVDGGTAVSAGVRVEADTPSGAMAASVVDTTDGVPNEAADTAFAVDNEDAMIQSVFINADGDELLIVFNRSVSFTANGAGDNAANQTQTADINGVDFEVDSDSAFGAAAALAGASNPAFAGSSNTAIMLDLDPMAANIEVGDFLRTTGMEITDILGNNTADDDDGAVVEQLATFQVTAVEWRETVAPNGGNVGGALAVTFNLPVDAGQLGTAAFYDLTLEGDDTLLSDAGDLVITNPTIDPDDARTVLLDVDSNDANLGVAPDGLNLDNDDAADFDGDGDNDENELSFSLNLEGDRVVQADEPQSDFGGEFGDDDADFDQDVTAGDAIAPGLAAGFGTAAFIDSDGDGTQDGVRLVFGESLDTDSDDDGVELRVNDGVTVHPVDMIDLITGERTEDETAPDTMDDNDVIAIDSVEITSTDVDGDGSISTRETNNTILFIYDPSTFDWDGDGDVGVDDTDGEAMATTDDSGVINIAVTAEDSSIADANGTALGGNITLNSTVDAANPVLLAVNFFTGDNIAAGMQKLSEQDNVVGDADDNNLAQLIFTEEIDDAGIDETEFRFGNGPDDRFAMGDSDGEFGADDNILQLTDNDANGFAPGDLLNVRSGNGLVDDDGNEFAGTTGTGLEAMNRTGPYIPLQRDVNGATIDSAFLVDTDADGFAERLDIFFTAAIDAATVQQEDFDVQGVDNDDLSNVTVNGARISIDLPDDTISISSTVNVTYNGGADDTPIASNGNPVSMMDDTFVARAVPTPNVDGEFTAVMDIQGTLTLDGSTPVPAGTKVFGFIAVPVAKSIGARMNNIDFKVNDSSSLEAFTNFVLGLSEFVYLYDDQGDMYFDNDKEDDSQDALLGLNVNANNLSNVNFSGRGVTTPGGGDSQPVTVNLQAGAVKMGWDVLRSNDGTAHGLFNFGFGDEPIASTSVITDDSGNYTLHMTAPVNAFGGRISSVNRPVIMVVELPTGERFAVSSLLNKISGGGPLLFNPNNRTQDNDGSAAGATSFNINLANVGMESAYEGWNLLSFARASGFATANNQIPTLPRGVTSSNVVTGVNLANATTLSQFVYFVDDDGDDEWTADDDNTVGSFDSMVIDANCVDHFAFTLTSRGVQTSSAFDGRFSNGILGLTGGYGVGFFNGTNDAVGVFQFGAPLTAGGVFDTAFPNSNVTLGWALVSYTPQGESDTTAEFFSNNDDSDFLIIFDRTSDNDVEISSASPSGGDTTEVGAQALFVHFDN